MAWSTTYTATTNSAMSAAQWNQNVRDNLLLTEVALAPSGWGSRLVSTGANAIAPRSTAGAVVATTQTTTATAFTDLGGPSVTAGTGVSAVAVWSVEMSNVLADSATSTSVAGGSTAASLDWACTLDGVSANTPMRVSSMHLFTGLTAGSNTFTMKYEVGSGTGSFGKRVLMVIAL